MVSGLRGLGFSGGGGGGGAAEEDDNMTTIESLVPQRV